MPKYAWIVCLILLLGLLFWGRSASSPLIIRVGVSQIVSHPAYDDIVAGIVQGFKTAGYEEGVNIDFDLQNAQGDQSVNASIAQKFAAGEYALLMPLGTPPSQAIVKLVKDRPVVFGAVTDPVSAGLVASADAPGANVTGTSDVTLYKEQLELLRKLAPSAKRLGIVHNPGEANVQYALEQARKYGEPLGFELVLAPANNTSEILAAAQSIAGTVDAFYMLPDNTVAAGQEALVKVALENKKPLVSLDQSGVEKGALATLGTNYKKVGERTAELAVRVLRGEKPADIPVVGVTDADLFINLKTAAALGIQIDPAMIDTAKQVYR